MTAAGAATTECSMHTHTPEFFLELLPLWFLQFPDPRYGNI